jgi:selenocysteine lyase/cysteine desulfurase
MLASHHCETGDSGLHEWTQAVSDYPIDEIRANYRALHEICYLNTGTVGIISETVLERHLHRIGEYERYGHYGEADARTSYESARKALAELVNADTAEIALTRNASDGVNFVLAGLSLPPTCTMITTDQEHPAVLLPMTLAQRKSAGRIAMLELCGSDDELLSQLNQLVEAGNVFLAVISHVSCETGRRLPIAEMCQICRDHGVLTLVDGAQSAGQFDVDVREIGCDFMTGNAHKWLCGPKGTGFLYIRRDLIDSLAPVYAGDGAVDPRFDRSKFLKDSRSHDWGFRADAERFEFGTRNWHLFGGVADSVHELASIGWPAIQRHVSEVSTELKSELSSRPKVTVHTPESWEQSCGIVTFSVDGKDGVELSDLLWDQFGVIQRRVQIPSGVRISCAHYTNRQDIATFLSALDQILQQ